MSMLGDRAQMERERLARQKRLRPPSPPRTEQQHQSSDEEWESDDGASEGSARKRARLDTGTDDSGAPGTMKDGRRTYPDGALLRIETQYATDPQTPGIRLTEILGPKV